MFFHLNVCPPFRHKDDVGSANAAQSVHDCGFVGSLAKFGSPRGKPYACRTVGCGETETVRGNQTVAVVGNVVMDPARTDGTGMAWTAWPMKRIGLATRGAGLGDM